MNQQDSQKRPKAALVDEPNDESDYLESGMTSFTALSLCVEGAAHLIPEGVSANSDGLRPARNKPGNVLADDWLTEDGASQDVSDGSIGALPHLLKLEL